MRLLLRAFTACAIGLTGCAFEVDEEAPDSDEASEGAEEATPPPGGMREQHSSRYCVLLTPHPTLDGVVVDPVMMPCPPPAGEPFDPREGVMFPYRELHDSRELTRPVLPATK